VPHILIVDDEQDMTWAVQHSLSNAGYDVDTAADGIEALVAIQRHRPDLLILDVILPRMDGLQVCLRVRQDPALAGTPVIMLTARSAIEDRVLGLDHGADDYLVKPFDLRELNARVRALLRRRGHANEEGPNEPLEATLAAGILRLDLHSRLVTLGDRSTQLTPAECDLLHFLLKHRQQIFSSEQLLRQVWGCVVDAADTGLVRWHVKNLRAKLEPDPSHPVVLRTVPHQGYILDTVEA
jgi:DNA-binding response OmpR family regulator